MKLSESEIWCECLVLHDSERVEALQHPEWASAGRRVTDALIPHSGILNQNLVSAWQ
jgi:hypothetical protein